MKKILSNFLLLFLVLIILISIVLSTIGIETNKFNNFITQKINENNKNLNLDLKFVNFKLDLKEISLFLETTNPNINYRNTNIPVESIKVYIDFFSLLTPEPQIEKINLNLTELNAKQLKNLSSVIKPSNFKSFVNNKIKQGAINLELEIFFNQDNQIDNFIAKGSVIDLKAKIYKNLYLEKTKFDFIADNSDILLKNVFGKSGPIDIVDGDLKVNLFKEFSLKSNFKTKLNYDANYNDFSYLFKKNGIINNITKLDTELNNNFEINFDSNYKIKDFDYKSTGSILNATLDFSNPINNYLLSEKVSKISVSDTEIKINYNNVKNLINLSGKYSLNNNKFLLFSLENTISNKITNLNIDLEYDMPITLEVINYSKPQDNLANISIKLQKQKNEVNFKNINYSEKNNSINLKGLKFKKKKFISVEKIDVKTGKNGSQNNNFSVNFKEIISIQGSHFDARNFPKIISKNKTENKYFNLNKEIKIALKNIIAPRSEKLKNFNLIGKIEKGEFVKINSKGDFGQNNFLDISLKNDKTNKKKFLEIYSDLTKPLLTEYNFFNGLTGGKLLFSSIIEKNVSSSKLKIEDFKVVNAPGMVKLLSLADLGGLADLAEGEGISFDILEITFEKNKNILQINEILAIGPSISVLMEGYQDKSVTSLRGTLIPAKTLNTFISKIPVIGNIVIPKEVGEGLFGISFKIKGPTGKLKTTINPIKTITPRFIQKILDKKNNSK